MHEPLVNKLIELETAEEYLRLAQLQLQRNEVIDGTRHVIKAAGLLQHVLNSSPLNTLTPKEAITVQLKTIREHTNFDHAGKVLAERMRRAG